MKNKPYIWIGRFYNHKNDFISLRLLRAGRCLAGKIARKAIRKKYACDVHINPKNWFKDANVQEYSLEPMITWIGHSTFLIQVGGLNIVTDPVFFNLSFFAKRVLKPGIAIDQLPKIDFVIISHNHMDHMDLRSIKALNAKCQPTFLVPHGNKKWLEQKGIKNVIEKQWWDEQLFNDIKFTFLPAVHWTSRGIHDINTTLWGSWMIESVGFKIYFAGDTAYSDHFEKIGKVFQDIDIALMPIGPVQPRNLISEAHTCPVEAINGFLDLNAKCLIPMHWGTFRSVYESFSAPALGLLRAWEACSGKHDCSLDGKCLNLLKIGESIQFEQK